MSMVTNLTNRQRVLRTSMVLGAAVVALVVTGLSPVAIVGVACGAVAVAMAVARPWVLCRGSAPASELAAGVVPEWVLFVAPAGRAAVGEQDPAAGPLRVVVGVGPAGGRVVIELAEAGPVLVTGASGSGRTSTVRLLAAQAVRAGLWCSIIDDRGAHAGWADEVGVLAGVDLWRSPGEIRNGLARLARRCQPQPGRPAHDDVDPSGGDRPELVVIEDLNRLRDVLGPDSRAARALAEVIYGGRAAGLHVIATSGPHPLAVLAEQFTTRIVSGRARGQVHVIDERGTEAAQVVYMTNDEANAWAAGGHADFTCGSYLGCPTCGEAFEPNPWAPENCCPTCESQDGTR